MMWGAPWFLGASLLPPTPLSNWIFLFLCFRPLLYHRWSVQVACGLFPSRVSLTVPFLSVHYTFFKEREYIKGNQQKNRPIIPASWWITVHIFFKALSVHLQGKFFIVQEGSSKQGKPPALPPAPWLFACQETTEINFCDSLLKYLCMCHL